MRRLHDLEPLPGVDLVGADDGAHLIVEYFGGGAGQAAQPGGLQIGEELRQRDAQRRGAVPHFERRKGMDMHVRRRRFHGAANIEIGLAAVIGVDAALHADLGGAAPPGFRDAPGDLAMFEVIRSAAQILAHPAFRKGAELAAEIAHIGVVDIAVDDVADGLAADLGAQAISGRAHRLEGGAAGLKQAGDFRFAERLAVSRPGQRSLQFAGRSGQGTRGGDRQRQRRARRPFIAARQPVAIAGAQNGALHVWREPALGRP